MIGKIIVFILIIIAPVVSSADITFTNGFWSTTFDCAEQVSITSEPTNICDGLDVHGYYSENDATPSSITSSSNYSGGGGGLGFRHNLASGDRNDHSAAMSAAFSTGQTEIWIRWYQRWSSGSYWSNLSSNKVIYFWSSANQWFYWMIPYEPDSSTDTLGYEFNGGDSGDKTYLKTTSGGWYSTQGDSTSADGGWDCYEVYIKINSASGVADGVMRTWVNGILVQDSGDFDLIDAGTGEGNAEFLEIHIGQNHDTAEHASLSDVAEDFDDIAIALPSYNGFVQDAFGNNMIGPFNTNFTTQSSGLGLSGASMGGN